MSKINNSQQDLINFALEELGKTFDALKQGKEPQISTAIEQLTAELESKKSAQPMSEQEIEKMAYDLLSKISKQ